jgi:hypothetical protein
MTHVAIDRDRLRLQSELTVALLKAKRALQPASYHTLLTNLQEFITQELPNPLARPRCICFERNCQMVGGCGGSCGCHACSPRR